MAATYTHLKYGKSVLDKLNKETQNKLNKNINLYYAFNQSFDIFYFYNFYNPLIGKKIRELGKTAHRNNINNYFENIINYITENNQEKNEELLCYLYGSINHYILDTYIHPYVFYKTGVYKKEDKNTHKYNGLHAKFEFALDAFFYEYDYKKLYSKINVKKELLPNITFKEETKTALDQIFNKTFNFNNISKIYTKSYKDTQFAFKNVIVDRNGIKQNMLRVFDKITTNKIKNLRFNSTRTGIIDPTMFNLKRDTWHHPCDKSVLYTNSLLDIYDNAVDKSVRIINMLETYFKDKKDLNDILKFIGNNSYITGLNSKRNKKLQYFEF